MLMRGITEVKLEIDSKVVTQIANMNEVKAKIIRLMGKNCNLLLSGVCGKAVEYRLIF